MIKRLFLILGIAIVVIVFSGGVTKSDSQNTGRAISLKVLQEKVKECLSKGNCPPNILQLCGIKKVLGYVIDEKNRDIILIGRIDDTMPPLYLDDFIIALKNTGMKYAKLKGYTYYYSNPGCSIDPDPKVLNSLQKIGAQILNSSNPEKIQKSLIRWHNVGRSPQQVRVLGIPFDTRFAKVMVEADYFMKRLVDGSIALDINSFTSLTDMKLNIIRDEIEKSKPISIPIFSLNRFWFYPGRNNFLEDKGVMYIQESEVILLTEEEFLTKRGEVVGIGRPNLLAQEFANSFSDKYNDIVKRRPIYAELEGLFRFVALTKIMKHRKAIKEAGINLDYLMSQYPVKKTPVSRTLPGITNVKEFRYKTETPAGYSVLYFWLPSCGGVSIDMKIEEGNITRDKKGSLFEIKKIVLKKRPSLDTLYWNFPAIWIINKEA